MIEQMRQLLLLIASATNERSTLDEVLHLSEDRVRWREAHALFNRIRLKTLQANRDDDPVLSAQYGFEEVCAKSLYNLSGQPAPFDAHSPYWVIPNALKAARQLGIEPTRVLSIVSV